MDNEALLSAVGVVTLAGFIRGITGFGGAMVMAPPLSYLIGAVPTVVIALTLEAAAALVVFPNALPKVRWPTLGYLIVPACLTVPIGGYLLVTLDPVIARKAISAVVVLFSFILLMGLRYSGKPRPSTSLALGSLVGVLLGATSIGAPPVILYLLSGPDPQAVTRANLTVFVTAISVLGLAMLLAGGVITTALLRSAALLAAPYLIATWFGGKLFDRLHERVVRRLSLGLMFTVGVVGLAL